MPDPMSSSLKRRSFARAVCVVVASLAFPCVARAATTYYVDPDWTGTKTGAAATPWTSLSGNWTTINNALATGDVTVYFSAREAASDTNDTTTTTLVVSRTATSAYRLTLDGNSYYNTSDTAPSWVPYSGPRKFQITAPQPVTTGSSPSSNVTVRGFRLISSSGGQIIYWRGGNNVIWEDNEGSDTTSGPGPGFYFEYTYYSGVAYSNLTIRRNYVHDTMGECIYVGGCNDTDGCLSHNGVLIEDNIVQSCGRWGGEPDGIDIKDGTRNVVIRGNQVLGQAQSRGGIVLETGAIVERNYLENVGIYGIQFSTYWNNAGPTRAGSVARNNILVNGGNSTSGDANHYGIYVDSGAGAKSGGANDQYTDLKIYNNTIYKLTARSGAAATGILAGAPNTTVTNNIVVDAATVQLSAPSGYLASHSNNLFYSSTGGTLVSSGGSYNGSSLTSFEATGLSADPMFINPTAYGPTNYGLQDGSPARTTAVTLSSFSDDYFAVDRGSSGWDRGAVECSNVPPRAPSDVRIVQ